MPFTYEFPRPSLAVDVVVITSESEPRVLLIRRGHEPYAGMWAFPGGYVNENEPLETAARRELQEETGLVVDELEQLMAAGDPGRDPRGWTISVVFLVQLGSQTLPVQANDDAVEAEWFPIFTPPKLAFDHAMILETARLRIETK